MALTSLVKLSISTIIHQHGSFVEKCELRALPESLLRELLLSSILRSRILFLRSLITIWPSQRLILRDVVEFDEPKAVLLAYCLQRVSSNLKLVDIRGCKISPLGTTAFCKLAMNLPISDNDVSGMKILDMRTASEAIQQNTTASPRQRSPPIVILFDGVFHHNNCYLAVQACRTRSIVDLKISHATVMAGIERNVVVALMDCLESEVASGLDFTLNELSFEPRLKAIAQAILPLTNLTELNLSYNNFCYRESNLNNVVLNHVANICSKLTKLKKLDLSGNYIKAGASIVLRAVNSSLTHLNLSGCGLKGNTLLEMSASKSLLHLQHLILNGNGLARKFDPMLTFILKSARTLEYLSIDENSFETLHVIPLCQMVKQLPFLKTLSLCFNEFSLKDMSMLMETFPETRIIYKPRILSS